MKFMKLGSKPDQFQTDGDNIRYVATELPTDMVINVGDVKFYLHKFPLLSKSSHLQKLVATSIDENDDEYHVDDIPGGPAAFEVCAKFCYGMVVTLNAYNVVAARCAAEYLEMYETIEKGNLVYKIDVFLTSSIFRSWKDSIIVLQTTKSLLTWSDELNIVSHCLDSIATKACVDPSKVDWSYTYNRRKLTSENGKDPLWNGVKKQQNVPKDWWVEDICELQIDLYKQVITAIRSKGRVSADVIGESLKAYSLRRIPSLSKGTLRADDITKYRYLVDTITWLLPTEKNSVPCGFLLKLLQASISVECGETVRRGLIQRIGQQLEEASVSDLLMRFPSGEMNLCSIDIVHDLVEQFVMQEHSDLYTGFTSDASKIKVASLVDGYLAESAKDSSFPLSKFIDLADMVSSFQRLTHDGIYRAIDMYLKEHPEMSKSEKKRICRLMDCKKLSTEACSHAVQNERLPLRVVVQILFFENARASGGSCGSSRTTTTNTDEEDCCQKLNAESVSANKVKKMFSRLWSNKDETGSDTSESAEETRSTPSRSR